MTIKLDAGAVKLRMASVKVSLSDDQIFQILNSLRSNCSKPVESQLTGLDVRPIDFLHLLQYRAAPLEVLVNLQRGLGLEFISPAEIANSIDAMATELKAELC